MRPNNTQKLLQNGMNVQQQCKQKYSTTKCKVSHNRCLTLMG